MSVMFALLLAFTAPDAAAPAGNIHFDVSAELQQGKTGTAVAVTFLPKSPDVHINQTPAPRFTVDAAQKVLLDKPAPKASAAPAAGQYLDTTWPVLFPVVLGPEATKGHHDVSGTVTFFYCSKKDGWCRKGTAAVDVAVTVP